MEAQGGSTLNIKRGLLNLGRVFIYSIYKREKGSVYKKRKRRGTAKDRIKINVAPLTAFYDLLLRMIWSVLIMPRIFASAF